VTERIYLGIDEDVPEVLKALFAILGPDADQRSIVWVPGDNAVDVPDEVAAEYLKPAKATKATKAAKAAPPPPPEKEE
jgi:hypothetical protein